MKQTIHIVINAAILVVLILAVFGFDSPATQAHRDRLAVAIQAHHDQMVNQVDQCFYHALANPALGKSCTSLAAAAGLDPAR